MTAIEVDPRDDPAYLTLAAAAKECGVRVEVLRELIAARALSEGVARSKRGHVYVAVADVPSWTQVEKMLATLYSEQLAEVAKRVSTIETEVEALRFDVTEAQENPDAPLGDDLLAASILRSRGYDDPRTLAGLFSKLQTEVMRLEILKRHLTEVREVF